jgi:hypothetical protein
MYSIKGISLKIVASSLVVGFISIGMSGCGAKLTPMQQEKIATFGIQDIEKNIQDVKDAKNNEMLDFYAPKNFVEAQTLAYKALSMFKNEEQTIDVYETVASSKEYLTKAYSSKTIIQKELSQLLSYKNKLDELHAKELFNDEYMDIYKTINEMINAIDEGDGISALDDRDETLLKARELYSKMKVASNLHAVEVILQSINQDTAPKSYQKAESVYKNAKFTINKFPDDDKIIQEVSQEALNEALYAQTIERETKKLIDIKKDIELYIKNEHDKLIDIYIVLNNDNKFRTLSYSSKISQLKEQVVKIQESLKTLQTQNQNFSTDSQRDKQTIEDLTSKIIDLQSKLGILEAKVEIANSQLLKTKDGSSDANTKLIDAQNQIASLQKSVEEAKTSETQKATQLITLQEELNKLNTKLISANEKLQIAKSKNSDLESKIEDKELLIKALKSENKTIKTKSEKDIAK